MESDLEGRRKVSFPPPTPLTCIPKVVFALNHKLLSPQETVTLAQPLPYPKQVNGSILLCILIKFFFTVF